MSDEREDPNEIQPIDPDATLDGLPVFKMREGESTHKFASRLVDALYQPDRRPNPITPFRRALNQLCVNMTEFGHKKFKTITEKVQYQHNVCIPAYGEVLRLYNKAAGITEVDDDTDEAKCSDPTCPRCKAK